LRGDNLIESVITRRSAEEMNLKVSDRVAVVIKSTEVMLQKNLPVRLTAARRRPALNIRDGPQRGSQLGHSFGSFPKGWLSRYCHGSCGKTLDEIRLGELNLRGVFDQQDAFVRRDELAERIQ
jgi:hypothetical protein